MYRPSEDAWSVIQPMRAAIRQHALPHRTKTMGPNSGAPPTALPPVPHPATLIKGPSLEQNPTHVRTTQVPPTAQKMPYPQRNERGLTFQPGRIATAVAAVPAAPNLTILTTSSSCTCAVRSAAGRVGRSASCICCSGSGLARSVGDEYLDKTDKQGGSESSPPAVEDAQKCCPSVRWCCIQPT